MQFPRDDGIPRARLTKRTATPKPCTRPNLWQYAKDPEVLRKAFTHVSDLLMAELVKDMKQ